MEIQHSCIVLRDMIESDIEDWIRWETVDTEWMDWDGPDMPSEPINEMEYRSDLLEFVNTPRELGFRSFFEIATTEGLHIGRINSYALDKSLKSLRWPKEGAPERVAIGIDICDSSMWGRGLGTMAIAAMILYFRENGIWDIYTQTWSGNIRMVRCAEKIGFVECNRTVGNRHIRGGVYDGLTFQLDLDRFNKFLSENP